EAQPKQNHESCNSRKPSVKKRRRTSATENTEVTEEDTMFAPTSSRPTLKSVFLRLGVLGGSQFFLTPARSVTEAKQKQTRRTRKMQLAQPER
ncbi:MAG TPA: hypothetical protein VGJ26_08990, partial [Pirellulales bacterium]